MRRCLFVIALMVVHSTGIVHAETFESDLISVSVEGEGPDVLLVPGLASSANVWDGTVARFRDQFRFHKVSIAGFAGQPPARSMPAQYLLALRDELVRYLEETDIPPPAMVGHSMGGLLTLMVASDAQDSLRQAVVVDALPFYSLLFNPQATADQVRPLATRMADQYRTMDQRAFRSQTRQAARNLTLTEDGRERIVTWAMASDRETYARLMGDVMAYDARPELRAINVPVRVILAYDSSMPAARNVLEQLYQDAYGGLEPVRLRTVEGAYHFLMWDQPEAFYRELDKVL